MGKKKKKFKKDFCCKLEISSKENVLKIDITIHIKIFCIISKENNWPITRIELKIAYLEREIKPPSIKEYMFTIVTNIKKKNEYSKFKKLLPEKPKTHINHRK